MLLGGLSSKTAETVGAPLDVGALPETEEKSEDAAGGREPVELLARVLAHLGHRLPILRKVERRLEGADSSSGVGSDFMALVTVLYTRNRETVMTILQQARIEAAQRKAAKQADSNGGTDHVAPVPPAVDIPDQAA